MSDEQNKTPMNVVIYWHMHQPEYRDLRNGEYRLPWTYLHTIKDYVDMVAHIENNADVKVVVNFAPVLLEQIDDYAQQLEKYLFHGQALRDPLLSALADPVLALAEENRIFILKTCLRANKERLVEPFDTFITLTEMAEAGLKTTDIISYYSEQFFSDILVWYHLAWMAETVRYSDPRIKKLILKNKNFSLHDRHLLVEVIHELIKGVIPRYKKLADTGRIELSMTPYAHPIMPLLLDIDSAKEALPEVKLPLANKYPGGKERTRWHMQKGIEVFKKYFGSPPKGCWPSEGGISNETIELVSEMGLDWVASGETVLRNSLGNSNVSLDDCIHLGYQFRETEVTCFFRDDGLSDLIGFKYSDWHADDAVANLIHYLEKIAKACKNKQEALVSIILDGENAWEYYPQNGYHFISTMYEEISHHKDLRLTTYTEYLSRYDNKQSLKNIVAGSWVYGTFSTWIGEKDKNRAWDMLTEAKSTYDTVIAKENFSHQEVNEIELQLAMCESSDWFWWFGEHNSAESVSAFDQQFRLHLSNLYQLLKVAPPEYLSKAFSFGTSESVAVGTMLPGQNH